MPTVELVHLLATTFMAGLIVFVQVVHYPLFARVDSRDFVAYEREHTVRTGWVVVPVMLVELATAVWIVFGATGAEEMTVAWAALGILVLIWLSTFALQAPAHRRLLAGFDDGIQRRLVGTNWIRTVGWMARVPLAVLLVG